MHPAILAPQDREDARRHVYRRAGVYAHVFWVMAWMMRLAIYGSRVFRAPPPAYFEGPQPMRFTHNRQLRRAQAACLRRIARLTARGRFDLAVDGPLKIAPRLYSHFAHAHMASTLSRAQYLELFAREGGGRARVFGLSSAHAISAYIRSTINNFLLSDCGLRGLNARAAQDGQAEPAPP